MRVIFLRSVIELSSVSKRKEHHIILAAKQVFIEKGFATVTMKDIIDASHISRGGIYLYFKSVGEIFEKVIELHNHDKDAESKSYIESGKPFLEILDNYFEMQKKRLLHIDQSLLVAMYEFRFTQKDDVDIDFFTKQFNRTHETIKNILQIGVQSQMIDEHDITILSSQIMYTVEGISTLGTAVGITQHEVNKQLDALKHSVLNYNKKR